MPYILLVEDDPFLIDIYTRKMSKLGHEVDVAETGSKVFAKLKERKPDLVLLDIVLPEISGWDVLKKIKENPEIAQTRVVILSNLGQRHEIEKGLKSGASAYLIKSQYTPSEVAEEIAKILKNKN